MSGVASKPKVKEAQLQMKMVELILEKQEKKSKTK